MKKLASLLVLVIFLNSCSQEKSKVLTEGIWLAELTAMDNVMLPFNFKLIKAGEDYQIEIYNAEEVISVNEIEIVKDSIIIKFPVYEGYIAGRFTKKSIEGQFIKESLDRFVPFKATYGMKERFRDSKISEENISGIWETDFDNETKDLYKAKGVFSQSGDIVTGTFRTETGDYRYLEGVMSVVSNICTISLLIIIIV